VTALPGRENEAMAGNWTIDVYEFGGRHEVTLRNEHWETTVEIAPDGDLRIEHEVDSDSYGGGTRNVACRLPMPHVVEFLRAVGYTVEPPRPASPSSDTAGKEQ
jgi:hypothetical protein